MIIQKSAAERRSRRRYGAKHYRWDLLPKLASEIEYGMRREAHRELTALIESFKHDSINLTMGKMRCAQTMSACMRGARRAGAPSHVIFDEHLVMLDQVAAMRSWTRVVRRLHAYLDELFAHRAPHKADSIALAGKIQQMLGSVRSTLSQPRTLEHYAEQLNVSAAHLSRTFSAIVGRPFRDEVRRIRCDEACRLLVHSQLKIAEIARRVGVQSASQFIADFRRDVGITPAEYRRRHPGRRPVREFA
jgi:AraC-like DNA-binding protein